MPPADDADITCNRFPGSKKWVACGSLLFEVRKRVTTIMVIVRRLTSVGARRTAGAVFGS